MAKKTVKSPYGHKTFAEAIKEADKNTPVSPETVKQLQQMVNHPLRTADDFRWFVLFNLLFSMDKKVNPGIENDFLRRIQGNILLSAQKYLK